VQQNLAAFGNQGMYSVRPEYLLAPVLGPFFTSSFYDTSPLRATLENVVDPALLNSGKQVVVTAVDVATGKLVRFGNTVSTASAPPVGAGTNGAGTDICQYRPLDTRSYPRQLQPPARISQDRDQWAQLLGRGFALKHAVERSDQRS
jgi:hypothetical protein